MEGVLDVQVSRSRLPDSPERSVTTLADEAFTAVSNRGMHE